MVGSTLFYHAQSRVWKEGQCHPNRQRNPEEGQDYEMLDYTVHLQCLVATSAEMRSSTIEVMIL
jgi:hypothetical protein